MTNKPKLTFCSIFVTFTLLALFFKVNLTNATLTSNTDTGEAKIFFLGNDASGILEKTSTLNYVSDEIVIDPAFSTGSFTTVDIKPNSFLGWSNLKLTGNNLTAGQSLTRFTTCSSGTNYISEAALPGNTAGFMPDANGEINLINLDPQLYPCIRARVSLNKITTSPTISSLTFNWKPLTVFLLETTGPTTKNAGENMTLQINYSVSYVTGGNVIVYLPLPTPKAGSYNPAYAQNLNLGASNFVSASNGGLYTATAKTIAGINIPANSVYWNLGAVPSGTAGGFSLILKANNGTQNNTIYEPEAVIVSAGSSQVKSKTPIKIISTPKPSLSKTAKNTISLNGANRVPMSSPYNGNVIYNLTLSNSSATATETLFNPNLTDDLTVVCTYLKNTCGENTCVNRVSAISDSGVFNATSNKITWPTLTSLAPATNKSVTFTVNYSGCPANTSVVNTGSTIADNYTNKNSTVSVSMGLDITPTLTFAKGDKTRFAGKNNGVTANLDNNEPYSFTDLADMRGKTTYNDTTTYYLKATNSGPVRLDNIILIDKIPAETKLVSIKVPGVANARFFYSVDSSFTDPTLPPAFDINQLSNPGINWTETAPSNLSNVTWVAAYIPCLKSSFFTAGGTCANAPSVAQAEIMVRANQLSSLENKCQTKNTVNLAHAKAYKAAVDPTQQNDSDVITLTTPFNFQDGLEKTWLTPAVPSFDTATTISGPASLESGTTGEYTVNVKNEGLAIANNLTISIPIPKVNIGGVDQYLDFINFTGAAYTLQYDGTKVNQINVNAGSLGVGITKVFKIQLMPPAGVSAGTSQTIIATVAAQDENNCAVLSKKLSFTTALIGTARLGVFERKDEGSTTACGDIHYQVDFDARGNLSSSNSFIVKRIPEKTIFKAAYTNGTDLDDHLNDYACTNCKVYFSKNVPPLPTALGLSNPLTIALIQNNFTLGREVSPGVWQPPINLPNNEVIYIAYLIDNTALPHPVAVSGQTGTVGLQVTNSEAGSSCSNSGTIIYSSPAVIANELIQAIGNTVIVPILDNPGLNIKKTASTTSVRAGEEFEYYIDYSNIGSISDDFVEITDLLPTGLDVLNVSHQWNKVAVNNGRNANLQNLTNSDYTSVLQANGSTEIKFNIAANFAGGDLFTQEGGRLIIKVKVQTGLNSGYRFINNARGCYSSPTSNLICLEDQHLITIDNPDLWLRKSVSNTNPVVGENLVYALTLTNKGRHDAPDTILTDTLPAGLCFKQMMGISGGGNWQIAAPHISAGDCLTSPTTLTWSNAHGNAISDGVNPGNIPHNSQDIVVRYEVEVKKAIAGQVLTNNAQTSTSIPEDNLYSNNSTQTVTIPLADPYVKKTVSAEQVISGEVIDYEISYGNYSPQEAKGVYLIDSLPKAQVIDLSLANNEVAYFYDANHAPALSTLGLNANYNFAANPNFKTNPLSFNAGEYATHIIILPAGNLSGQAGPFYINLSMKVINPANQNHLITGTILQNKVDIFSADLDTDNTNNSANVSSFIPNINLKLSKKLLNQELAAGDTANYQLILENNGHAPVCGVWVQDVLPAELQNFTQSIQYLDLENNLGADVLAVNGSGLPIATSTKIDFDPAINKWYLGEKAGDAYKNVCLPVNTKQIIRYSGTVLNSLSDGFELINTATIGQDMGDTEDIMTDNQAQVISQLFRTDLAISKIGSSCGSDINCAALGSQVEVNPSEFINYEIKYGNISTHSAKNVVITDLFDSRLVNDICFVSDSLRGAPAGSTIEYSNDDASTWDYIPSGTIDCNITSWRIHFADNFEPTSGLDQSIFFKIKIKDTANINYLPNAVNIKSIAPEINYDNNNSIHQMYIPQTDIKIDITVDEASVIQTEITPTSKLIYHLHALNQGPSDAYLPVIRINFPPSISLPAGNISLTSRAGVNFNLSCTLAASGQELICQSDKNLDYLDEIVFDLPAGYTDSSSLTTNENIDVSTCITTITSDLNPSNNCSQTKTVIANLANVILHKNSFSQAYIGEQMTYTLDIQNTGKLDAADWEITENLDANLINPVATIDFAHSSSDLPFDTSCTYDSNTHQVFCGSISNLPLPSHSYGKVILTADVKDDLNLIKDDILITNQACITTTSPQVDTLDDCATVIKPALLEFANQIGGRAVYGANLENDCSATMLGIANSDTYLAGRDMKGRLYGPELGSERFTEIMNGFRTALVNAGYISSSLSNEDIAALPEYRAIAAIKTNADGSFAFGGLIPGLYNIYHQSPTGFVINRQNFGQIVPYSLGQDFGSQLTGISLAKSEASVDNCFVDVLAKIDGYIWHDIDWSATQNGTESALAGIKVDLYRNGVLRDDILTDIQGYYDFGTLLIYDEAGISYTYEVKIDESTLNPLFKYTNGIKKYTINFNDNFVRKNHADFALGESLPIVIPPPTGGGGGENSNNNSNNSSNDNNNNDNNNNNNNDNNSGDDNSSNPQPTLLKTGEKLFDFNYDKKNNFFLFK